MGASSESGASKNRTCNCFAWACIAAVMVVYVMGLVYLTDRLQPPVYSATITAVSGLDPETDLRQKSPLSPVFNLTVGVASQSWSKGAQISPRMSVKVSYSHLCLRMASGHVPPDVSVGPQESRDLPSVVVASGRDVAVPGFLMDSLAEEMRTGQAMFEVKLIESQAYGWRDVAKGWGVVGDTITLRPS